MGQLNVFAQISYSENFDYTTSTDLISHGSWAQAQGNASNHFQISSPAINMEGYERSATNSATAVKVTGNASNTEQEYVAFPAAISTGDMYCSFLINVISALTTDDYMVAFSPSTTAATYAGGRLFVKSNGTNIAFGIHADLGGSPQAITGYTYDLNTTYLIIMQYSFIAGTNNNTLSLYVISSLPTLTSGSTYPQPTPTLGPETATGGDMADILNFSMIAHSSSMSAYLDVIKVASAWSDLFPVTTNIEKRTQTELISMYPNPAEDIVYFSKPVSVTLMNTEGKILTSRNNIESFETKGLTSGVYILKCNIDNAFEYKRIVVK